VDLEIRAGERWFLLGPNGAGKTTLLRAILGLLAPERGAVAHRTGLDRVGFVPQRCDLNDAVPTTIREFVLLGLVGLRVAPGERAARLADALAQAGLRGLAERSYWSLSGGQRQRALVARALIRLPALLVLDEPTEGLDVTSEEAFLEALATGPGAAGRTLLFVTHRLAIAARLATHLAIAANGRVVAGPREAVLATAGAGDAFGAALVRVAMGAAP
jgi:ABC-type Mn2+/Zn2+ transport system ATPase subunit